VVCLDLFDTVFSKTRRATGLPRCFSEGRNHFSRGPQIRFTFHEEENMHDIDRTQKEFEMALHEIQPEVFEYSKANGIGEYEGESAYESWGEFPAQESWQEASLYEGEMYEGELYESGLSEADEMELAAEFLEITTEGELDQFLGNLVRKAGRAIGKAVKSPLGRAIGGVLKPLAKAALPVAGKALGTFVGGPVGGMIGGKLASAAGRMFGLELEGLSAEDREFEVARRFVRMASATTKNALNAPPNANPVAVAKQAAAIAGRKLAPGLSRRGPADVGPAIAGADIVPAGSRRRGSWIRRGRRIILLGV
jgi:hypothetical protein